MGPGPGPWILAPMGQAPMGLGPGPGPWIPAPMGQAPMGQGPMGLALGPALWA